MDRELKLRQGYMGALEFFYWVSMACLSFQSTYLMDMGQDSVAIGNIMAGVSLVGMIAPPIFGVIADRLRSTKKSLLLSFGLAAVVYLILPNVNQIIVFGVSLSVILMIAGTFFRQPGMPLVDGWLLQLESQSGGKLVYTRAKKFASVGYALTCFLGSFLAKQFGSGSVFYLIPIFAPAIFFISMKLDPSKKDQENMEQSAEEKSERKKLPLSKLFKNYYLMTFYLCIILAYIPINGTGTFWPYLFEEVLGDRSAIGTMTGIKTLIEIPTYMLIPFFLRKVSVRTMIGICFGYYGLEQILFATTNSPAVLLACMVCQGVAFASISFACMRYIFQLAPRELSATAVTLHTSLTQLSGILGNMIGGNLVESIGLRGMFWTSGGVVLVSAVLFIVALLYGKMRHIAVPEAQQAIE